MRDLDLLLVLAALELLLQVNGRLGVVQVASVVLERLLQVVVVYLDQVLLARQVVRQIGHCCRPSCLHRQILDLLELHGLVAFRVDLEVVGPQVVALLKLVQLERFVYFVSFRVLSRCLGLHHGPLLALTLQDPLFAAVLHDFGDLRLALGRCLVTSSIALRGARTLHFAATLG